MIGSKEIKWLWFSLAFLLVFSCELEQTDYPPEPFIEFRELQVIDSGGILGSARYFKIHFYLIDGDGDIGPIYHPEFDGKNCNVELFYKSGANYQLDTLILEDARWFEIPYVGDLGHDKALKADVYIDYGPFVEVQRQYTNFFLTITVYDMALNKSNTIHTDTIILDK
jgi:hypothetical protein